jgi:di/tripeptidase
VVVALLAGCLFWTVEKRQERLKSKTGESGRQDKQGHEATAAKGRNRLLALVAVTGLTVGLIGVSHLKSQANGLKSEVAVLTDDNEDLKSRTDDVESRVDDLESKLDRR